MSAGRPSIYIPTLYVAEGLPYTLVMMMSAVFFKNVGATNEFIGLTSFLYIPWTIKLFWAPLVDFYGTRRRWIVVSQLVLAGLIATLAAGAVTPYAISLALGTFALVALVSATQDIAIDGYYLDVLNKEQQAFYVGVRNAAYKVAWLLGSGGLVYIAGRLGESVGIAGGWAAAFAACAVVFLAFFAFHSWYLPAAPRRDGSQAGGRLTFSAFVRVFTTYFDQPRIAAVVAFILIFRLGDALMLKMAQPFLLDPPDKGGLGMSTADVGLIYGTIGTIFLLLGGLVGGWLVARGGLRKWLLPCALIQNGAIPLYWLLAVFRPGLWWVAGVNAVEQLCYGLGVAAYTVFLLSTVKAEYKAAHYATATALMAVGLMVPGAASGYLVGWLGYQNFFLFSSFAAIPGIITLFCLPLKD